MVLKWVLCVGAMASPLPCNLCQARCDSGQSICLPLFHGSSTEEVEGDGSSARLNFISCSAEC